MVAAATFSTLVLISIWELSSSFPSEFPFFVPSLDTTLSGKGSKNVDKDPDDDGRQRFLLELEFVQCLANPTYIHELAHQQQFFFWKNFRNNRLKHILPRPLPEPALAPFAPAPPPAPAPHATMAATAPPPPALSPMQYVVPPGSSLMKNE
ncbi:hypothetical protein CRG98_009848 [Punica granatum]|uniref:Mediator of RNA polymerase II transcription subunit 31 n=1 Tax=Punica granatum TaxID=22663 RepID=A0A2I0KMH7_PUNGR|nr:hypothetical protein CRG98_009848 [Punica granatum]